MNDLETRPPSAPSAPEADPSLLLRRRSLLAYAVSAPVMTVAAGFGVNLAASSDAMALPLPLTPADTVDYYDVVTLEIPQRESRCEIVTGDTLEQKVDALAHKLVEVTAAL